MADVAAFTLSVRPTHHDTIPAHTGRAAHAALLKSLQRIDPALSALVHDGSQLRPLTASPLLPVPRGELLRLHPDTTYTLRFTTLHPDLTQIALNALVAAWERDGLNLHDQPLRVESVAVMETTYAALRSRYSGGGSPRRTVGLRFLTPTVFKKTGDLQVPLPQPVLVFDSLLNRWNAFAPPALALPAAELHAWVDQAVTISDLRIHSERVSFERANRGTVIGFVGAVTFSATSASRDRLAWLHTLADYAVFSGVGAKLSMGLGQVERITPGGDGV